MIKNPCFFLCLFALIICSGCLTGSHIVTGNTRPPSNWKAVRIYHVAPENSEIIGIVTAPFSGASQSQTDFSLSLLKKSAAEIGANGIVLGGVQTSDLQGTAIFVP